MNEHLRHTLWDYHNQNSENQKKQKRKEIETAHNTQIPKFILHLPSIPSSFLDLLSFTMHHVTTSYYYL